MKILVKGNVIARGNITYMESGNLVYRCGEQKESDFGLVIYGDLKVDNLFINKGFQIFCEGDIISLGMTDEQIKAKKGE